MTVNGKFRKGITEVEIIVNSKCFVDRVDCVEYFLSFANIDVYLVRIFSRSAINKSRIFMH